MDDKNNISQPESQTTVNDATQINQLHDNKSIQQKTQMTNNDVSSNSSPQSSEEQRKIASDRLDALNTWVIFVGVIIIMIVGLFLYERLVKKTTPAAIGALVFVFAPLIWIVLPAGLALAYKLFAERRAFHKEFGKLSHNATYIVSSIAAVICVFPAILIIVPLIIQICMQLFRTIF